MQGWWGPKDTPRLLSRLVAGSHCFLLALRGGEPVGMGRAISDGASDAYIQDVMVLSSERGRGTGSAVVRALAARLRKDGLRWIGLIAQDGSAPFYEKLSFKVLKRAQPMLSRESHV